MTAIEKYAELIEEHDKKSRGEFTKYAKKVSAFERAEIAASHIVHALFMSLPVTAMGVAIGKAIAPELATDGHEHKKTWMKIGMSTVYVLDKYGIVKLERMSTRNKNDDSSRRASMYDAWIESKKRSSKKKGDWTSYMIRLRTGSTALAFIDKLVAEVSLYAWDEDNRMLHNECPEPWRGIRHPRFGTLISHNKGSDELFKTEKFKKSLAAVNKLQSTPFYINEEVYNRLNSDRRSVLATIKSDSKGMDSYTSKKYTFDRAMNIAGNNIGAPVYSPVYLDSRGRTYYGASYLSRSGDDFSKGLLMVEPEEIGYTGWDNLLVAAIDFRDKGVEAKMSYEDKLNLAYSQVNQFIDVANGGDYTEAGEMTQYLSVCIDIRNAYELGKDYYKYKSGVLLSRDASQSGPMIMGFLTQDYNTMKYTNVLKSNDRHDLYEKLGAQMLVELKAYNPGDLKELVERTEDSQWGDSLFSTRNCARLELEAKENFIRLFEKDPKQLRKWSKYPLMLFGYSGEAQCIGADLWNKMHADHDFLEPVGCLMIAKLFYKSCQTAIPAVYQFMTGLKKFAGVVHKTKQDLTSISPYSGFPFVQSYWKMDNMDCRVGYDLGSGYKQIEFSLRYKTDKRNYNKTKSSTPANFVHSLDSDLLKMVVNEFPHTIATNHDAFFATPSRITELDEVLRKCTKEYAINMKPLNELLLPYGMTPDEIGITINPLNDEFQPENNEYCYS